MEDNKNYGGYPDPFASQEETCLMINIEDMKNVEAMRMVCSL